MRDRTPLVKTQEFERARDGALRLLEEYGIACPHALANERLQAKSGIRVVDGRLRFPRDEVAAHLERKRQAIQAGHRAAQAAPGAGAFRMGGHWNCLTYLDPATGAQRGCTHEEAVRLAKLSEMLGARVVPVPLAPGDVDPAFKTIACERIALLHTRELGGWLTATDPAQIRLLIEMYRAAGRRYKLGLEGLITPLRFNPAVFDLYFEWRDDPGIEIGIMGGIPMAGATAPLVFPANLALSLAEGLALDYVMYLLSDGATSHFDFRLEPFDMKAGNLVYGTPEYCLLAELLSDFREFLFGVRSTHGSFRTNAKTVDAQAIMERTACFMWQASLGCRSFGAVGQMSMDEVYSPVQAVLDREILKYGERVYRGFPDDCFDAETDIVQLVKEGSEDGTFMVHETTVDTFRSFYDMDRMATTLNLSAWQAAGSRRMEETAWDEAQRLMNAHAYELPDDRRLAVDRLYDEYMRSVR
jgi:trimethylamine:corrinoid methyltransferase-like protein